MTWLLQQVPGGGWWTGSPGPLALYLLRLTVTVVIPTACAGDVVHAASPCSTVNHLRWDLSAQQIRALTTQLIEQTKSVYDRVGAQGFEDVSYESTLKALADVEVTYTGECRQ